MKNDPQVLAAFNETLLADERRCVTMEGDPNSGQVKLRGWFGGETRAASFNDQEFTSIGMSSVKSFDRYRTILEPEGWDLENYRKNPVVLVNHWDFGPQGIPIGKSIDERIVSDGLLSKTQFAVKETQAAGSSRVAEIWALHRGGYFGALSVSFIPLEWEEFQAELTPGDGPVKGIRFLRNEKLEHSLVAVPGNADAVTMGLSKVAVASARRFGIDVPETELPGDLGMISRACRMVVESEDLKQSLLDDPDGDRVIRSEVERIRKTYRLLSAQPDEVAPAVAAVIERLRAVGAEIRSAL